MNALSTCSSSESPRAPENHRTPVYSLDWATTIVERAMQSYPRAWEIIMDATALSKPQLAYLLACKDPSWASLREMVHTLDRWIQRQALVGPKDLRALPITTQMLSNLLRIGGKNAPESLYRYLTDRIASLTIEEQVERAEGVGSAAPDILSAPPTELTALGVQYVFDFG